MRKVPIGNLHAGVIGMGCMSFAGVYGSVDEAEAVRSVHAAIDRGVTMFDTADVYGLGTSERLLGKALRGRRDGIVIATKFGNIDHAGPTPTAELYEGRFETCGRPDYVIEACERSLVNLGVEVIDLYYFHRIDKKVPIEDTVLAMARLVEAGKVREIGLSEANEETIRRAHAVHPVAALQSEYSLWSREAESSVFPVCRELGITYVAYSPLGRGFLTGTVPPVDQLSAGDWRRHQPRFEQENYRRNKKLLGALDDIAASHGSTIGQVALAWVLAADLPICAIPGSKSVVHSTENAAAAEINLSPGDIDLLSKAYPPGVASGARYPELQLERLDKGLGS